MFGTDYAQFGYDHVNVSVASYAMTTLFDLALSSFSVALLVQLAYDAELGRRLSPLGYVMRVLKSSVVILVLTFLSLLAIVLAGVALIVPAVWLAAILSAVMPAIVIEGKGFGALWRSVELTRDHRWPIAGLLLVIGLCAFGFQLFGVVVMMLVLPLLSTPVIADVIAMVILSLFVAMSSGLFAAAVAQIYIRLRDIKQGVIAEDLPTVFE
mgnify:CR=1 FL=1